MSFRRRRNRWRPTCRPCEPGGSFTLGKLTAITYGHRQIKINDKNGQEKTIYIPLFRIEIGSVAEAKAVNRVNGMDAKIYFPPEENTEKWELTDVRRPNLRKKIPGTNTKTLIDKEALPYPLSSLDTEDLSAIEFFIVYYDTEGTNIYFNPVTPQKFLKIFKRLLEPEKS